ncbi:DUF1244 domain-containing protein [Alphaproteobacteria bacterium]|nr:DUF1244 domain-containing protein [Alphaproteobacteria bacterium]
MDKKLDRELLADVAERLISHLQKKTEVQNIDLMNLSGFCRNCLSKWYLAAAEKRKINLDYDKSRELIYGMPYDEWKNKYQKDATKQQLEKYKKK